MRKTKKQIFNELRLLIRNENKEQQLPEYMNDLLKIAKNDKCLLLFDIVEKDTKALKETLKYLTTDKIAICRKLDQRKPVIYYNGHE